MVLLMCLLLKEPKDKMTANLCFVGIIFYFFNAVACVSIRETEKEILEHVLSPDRYDARLRPPGNSTNDSPTIVYVNFFIRSLTNLDDMKMQYNVQLTFRQQWTDERLKYDDQNGRIRLLTLTKPKLIWTPDTFFSNENDGHFHDIMTPNLYYRIFPSGSVLYSRRLSLTLSCPMNLKLYPLDRQTCSIRLASYGYATDNLIFLWKEGDPVQITKSLLIPKFTLESISTDYCNSKTNTGEYSCLKVNLLFKREFLYYLIQLYIPCCMMVITSWMSFWFDPSAVHARMLLALSTMFMMAVQTSIFNTSNPPVSYTKSIDVWTGVCMTFVFGAFVEFVFVNYINRSNYRNQAQNQEGHRDVSNVDVGNETDCENSLSMKSLVHRSGEPLTPECKCTLREQIKSLNCCKTWFKRFQTKARAVDVLSRILFPVFFLLFNLIYWISYAMKSD